MIRRVLLLSASLCVSLFGAVNVVQATTIAVTTFQDEDGENSSGCSLREAIKASGTKLAYGGCKAGQQYYTDTIQLQAGQYGLSRGELIVSGDMVILGDTAYDQFAVDSVTGAAPKRLPIATTIAAGGSRIFNSAVSHSLINLANIILKGGTATDFGGSIRAGGGVVLSRVQIDGAKADKQGGAIYLEGSQATLSAVASSFTGNNAPSGAVLSMSCLDNLNPTARTITLSQVSVTGNGSSGTSSILDFCGEVTASINTSTIAQNSAQNIDLDSDLTQLVPAIVRMVGKVNSRLGRNSSLGLISNTLVENNGIVLTYASTLGLGLTNNILAYNTSTVDCRYTGPNDPLTSQPPKGNTAFYNLFSGTAASNKCELYPEDGGTDTNIYSGTAGANQLSDVLNPIGFYAGFDLLGYLPTITSIVINKGESISNCGGVDQRGLIRNSGVALTGSVSQVIQCDIGALELSILTANDNLGGINASYDTVINTTVDTTGLTDIQAKSITEENAKYLAAYKSSYRYRQVVMDVLANDFAQEVASSNTSMMNVLSDETKYTITASGSADGSVHCEWNPVMKQLLASRKDGSITPSGEGDECKYKITPLSGGDPVEARVTFRIGNIAPIAKNDPLTLPFGAKSIPLNILANDSDDGDGPVGGVNYPAGKTPFYEDSRLVNGVAVKIPANIRFITKPTQGHIVAQYEQPCPNNNNPNVAETTCYGGTLTYVNDNLFSPFNDSFTYQVLDSDQTASNTATVTVTNTATTTDREKSGGGSFGLGALLGLVSLMFIRRRMVN